MNALTADEIEMILAAFTKMSDFDVSPPAGCDELKRKLETWLELKRSLEQVP